MENNGRSGRNKQQRTPKQRQWHQQTVTKVWYMIVLLLSSIPRGADSGGGRGIMTIVTMHRHRHHRHILLVAGAETVMEHAVHRENDVGARDETETNTTKMKNKP